MEPRTLTAANIVPGKDIPDIDKTQRALAELSLNKGMSSGTNQMNSRSYLDYTVAKREFGARQEKVASTCACRK
jgi:hypothetical protein